MVNKQLRRRLLALFRFWFWTTLEGWGGALFGLATVRATRAGNDLDKASEAYHG